MYFASIHFNFMTAILHLFAIFHIAFLNRFFFNLCSCTLWPFSQILLILFWWKKAVVYQWEIENSEYSGISLDCKKYINLAEANFLRLRNINFMQIRNSVIENCFIFVAVYRFWQEIAFSKDCIMSRHLFLLFLLNQCSVKAD